LELLEAKCQPDPTKATPPAVRVLALVRGRVLDSCTERIRQLVSREVKRVPHFLSREEVKALVQTATMGLFPEAEEEGSSSLSQEGSQRSGGLFSVDRGSETWGRRSPSSRGVSPAPLA